MWIFGYGSLMWGRWEMLFDCMRRTKGDTEETPYRMVLNLKTLATKRLSEKSEIVLVEAATIFCRTEEVDEFEQLSQIGPQMERTKDGV